MHIKVDTEVTLDILGYTYVYTVNYLGDNMRPSYTIPYI